MKMAFPVVDHGADQKIGSLIVDNEAQVSQPAIFADNTARDGSTLGIKPSIETPQPIAMQFEENSLPASSLDNESSTGSQSIGPDSFVTSEKTERAKEIALVLKKRTTAYNEAKTHFRSEDGIIYVSRDLWTKYCHYGVDVHLYVSSDQSTIQARETEYIFGNLRSIRSRSPRPSPDSKSAQVLESGNNASVGEEGTRDCIPDRIRICNKLLIAEMQKITEISRFNCDHVPPFRSIVPYEQRFRASLERYEREFAALAARDPDNPAVKRTRQWVPMEVAYQMELWTDSDGLLTTKRVNLSDSDRIRILLDGLRVLIRFLDHDLADLVRAHREIQRCALEKIPFSYLWHLFWPGQEIVVKRHSHQIYRVLQVSGGRRSIRPRRTDLLKVSTSVSNLVIDCFYLDFDGKKVRSVPQILSIRPYEDLVSITALDVYPLAYENKLLRESLVQRGRKFVELVKVSHRRYVGLNLTESDFSRYEEIDSDVIIDFELAFRSNEVGTQPPDYGGGVILQPTEEAIEEFHQPGIVFDDEELRVKRRTQFVQRNPLLEDQTVAQLDEDGLVLLPYRVYGYVLLSRRWFPLDIDLVKEIPKVGEHDAFDDLALPKNHREIVRALVKTHDRSRFASKRQIPKTGNISIQREFDVVKGKGKGLIILLHGPPGVGKTSTAECVAAHTGRPLFPITCGDIGGTTAREVEENLERFFDLARKWGCVLLLDEADVFVSQRSRGNIQHNILVSVFLRVLEYYSGILILTTNRVGDFDEAITSRVHLALYYPELDATRSLEIWEKNIERLRRQNAESDIPVIFDKEEIMEFARNHVKSKNYWNGRQIKNAFQTAVAMADWDNIQKNKNTQKSPRLRVKHFQKVAAASAHFKHYLDSVRNPDSQRARLQEFRRDEIVDTWNIPKHTSSNTRKNVKRSESRNFVSDPYVGYDETESSDSSSNGASDDNLDGESDSV